MRRSDDGRQRDVFVLDDRVGPFRQSDMREVQRIVDIHLRDIGQDAIRDVLGRANQFDGVADDVEHAAALQTGRRFVALKVDRNGEADGGAFGQAHEIDMDGAIGDRIALDFARDHAGDFGAVLEAE